MHDLDITATNNSKEESHLKKSLAVKGSTDLEQFRKWQFFLG
jgi:hypothetical protein